MSNPYQVVGSPNYSAPLVNLFNQQQQKPQQSGQQQQPGGQQAGQLNLAQFLQRIANGQGLPPGAPISQGINAAVNPGSSATTFGWG